MRSFLFFMLFLTTIPGIAQTREPIATGNTDNVYSSILKENRKLLVYAPPYDSTNIFAPQRYPVIYLLDGDTHFLAVKAMIQQLSERTGGMTFPEMIIVGILNTDRNRDLTPTQATAAPGMSGEALKRTGGGEQFLSFIQKELIPHIDSLYPTAPYRVLMGHSFGGLTAIYTLLHHPGLFNAYIASDPSLSWDDSKLLKQAKTILQRQSFSGSTLYMAIANTMDKGMDTLRVKKDTTLMSRHIRSILQMAEYLNTDGKNGLREKWSYYPDYNHATLPLVSAYDGLRFIFNAYDFELSIPQFFDSTYTKDSLIDIHYKELSRQMGYRVSPPEIFINNLAYNLQNTKQFKRAYHFFRMNIENYPNSFNVYDSMGDYYAATGDQQKARNYYLKALAIRDFADTRKKLEQLK